MKEESKELNEAEEDAMLGDSDLLDCLSGLVSPYEQQEERKEHLSTKNKRQSIVLPKNLQELEADEEDDFQISDLADLL